MRLWITRRLPNANLIGAIITGASFNAWTSGVEPPVAYTNVITKDQLYSSASYQAKDLQWVGLEGNDLSGWDFSGQNLTNARMSSSLLTDANLSLAVVTGTQLGLTSISEKQLYSTQSYQDKNLQGIVLNYDNLADWDFRGQNLTNSSLFRVTVTNADFTGQTSATPC